MLLGSVPLPTGRCLQPPLDFAHRTQIAHRNVSAYAKKAGYKLKAPGSPEVTALPPEAVVTEYPAQLAQVGFGTKSLASTDVDSDDPEVLTAQGAAGASDPDVELLLPDGLETEASAEEENPYTAQDALR